MVQDLLSLQGGFEVGNERWHIVCLGVKGDMPFLRTAGGFIRNWQRAVRSEAATAKPFGVCWLCMAGTIPGGPFEDMNVNARWTQVPTTNPWLTPPVLLRLFHCVDRPYDFFKADIWHNYHGGAGKTFISSVLAECLNLLPGSKEAKIASLDGFLREWAKRPGCSLPHSGGFCQERIGLTSFQVLPEGGWSKFADTYTYHKFVEWFLSKRVEQIRGDEILWLVWEAVTTINQVFTTLYTSGLWLTPDEARTAGEGGRKFLSLYAHLAHKCMVKRHLRFPVYVKFHMLDHQFRRLLQGSCKSWTLNPLGESVQADEDNFVETKICSHGSNAFFTRKTFLWFSLSLFSRTLWGDAVVPLAA